MLNVSNARRSEANFESFRRNGSFWCSLALVATISLALVCCSGSAAQAAIISQQVGVTLNAANLDSYNLDVDHNMTTDFTFQAAYVPDPVLTVGFDQITFPFGGSNAAVIDMQTGDGFPPVSLLKVGNTVSSSSLFSGPNDTADLYFDDTLDPITGNYGGKTGYVGFSFAGAGGTHYGYAEVSVNSLTDPNAPFDLTIGRVVYNDVAGAAIQITAVPEPAEWLTIAPAMMGLLLMCRRNKFAGNRPVHL